MSAPAVADPARAEAVAESPGSPMLAVLRAGALLLIVAGQSWLLHPFEGLEDWRPLSGLLQSGGSAPNVLLVCSGFVVARGMLVATGSPLRSARRVLLGHFLPVAAAVCLALLLVGAVVALDGPEPSSAEVTRTSFEQVLGFNWNHYIASHALAVRSDLVGLWYFSVEAQTLPLVVLAVVLLGRRPRLLTALVVGALVAAHTNQLVLSGDGNWFQLGLRTVTRADAVLWGFLAALVVHLVGTKAAGPRRGIVATQLTGALVVLYAGVVLAQAYLPAMALFQGGAIVIGSLTGGVLAAATLADRGGTVFRLDEVSLLRDLGRVWPFALALLGPFLFTFNRNTSTWTSGSRLVIGGLAFVLLLYVLDQVVRPAVLSVVGKPLRRLID